MRPIENIDGIKIVQVDGLTGGKGGSGGSGDGATAATAGKGGGPGLADQVVSSALQYRSQAPLIDAIMKEVGLSGGDLQGLAAALGVEADGPGPDVAAD